MFSPSSIITGGLGSWGDTSSIITLGYGYGDTVIPVASTEVAQSGGSGRKTRQRKFVQIGEELHEVNNQAEARMLLDLYGTKEQKQKKPKIIVKSIVNQPVDDFGTSEKMVAFAKPPISKVSRQEWDDELLFMLLG